MLNGKKVNGAFRFCRRPAEDDPSVHETNYDPQKDPPKEIKRRKYNADYEAVFDESDDNSDSEEEMDGAQKGQTKAGKAGKRRKRTKALGRKKMANGRGRKHRSFVYVPDNVDYPADLDEKKAESDVEE